MYSLVETNKNITVKFNKDSSLRDAPSALFSTLKYKSINKARKEAKKYAKGILDTYTHTKNLSMLLREIPELGKKKIGFHVDNVKNKTGVVGVSLVRSYPGRTACGYRTSYHVKGRRVVKYFAFSKYFSAEDAFHHAVAFRMNALNTNRDILNRQY